MFRFILILHLLGACIWVGGHLVLLFTILPKALREGDPGAVLRFEHGYERIGIPALLIQAVTGIWLAARYVPGIWPAFTFDDPLRSAVAIISIRAAPARSPTGPAGMGGCGDISAWRRAMTVSRPASA